MEGKSCNERTAAMKRTSWKERKSKTNRKEELKRKKDKKGGNEINGLKQKEEVNELDEHIETKGREVTKWTPWNERNGKWQWTGWKRWNDGKKVTKGREEFKTKGTRYREQERRVETKGKEVTNRSVELQRKDGRDEMDAWKERRR